MYYKAEGGKRFFTFRRSHRQHCWEGWSQGTLYCSWQIGGGISLDALKACGTWRVLQLLLTHHENVDPRTKTGATGI
jgi:hypothetical protein